MTLPALDLDRILALAKALDLKDAEVRISGRRSGIEQPHSYRVEFHANNAQAMVFTANTIEVAANNVERDLEARAKTLLRERESSAEAMRKALALADQHKSEGESK
jgi:hypothetical protein